MADEGTLDPRLKEAAALALYSVRWREVKEQAARLFPLPPAKNDKPLPPVSELVEERGDAVSGRVVFNTTGTCSKCHLVNGIGKDVGPNLSEIGNKLSREALFHTILFPSAGISHNYETHIALLTDGSVVTGIMTSDAADSVSLKDADAIVRTIPRSEIDEIKQQEISLMPADLQKTMTAEELIDVVEYLTTLKAAQEASGGR
jgi:putative heme-binding domain-containing protein